MGRELDIPPKSPFDECQRACRATVSADIYLYAPSLAQTRLHVWQNVNFGLGTYETTLNQAWWNNSQSTNLQLSIVPAGTAPFLATMPYLSSSRQGALPRLVPPDL